MKVGTVITRMVQGGAARIAWETARGIVERGHEVFFAAGPEDYEEPSSWLGKRDSDPEPVELGWLRRQPGPWDLEALFELVHLFRRRGPDCVHLHTSKAGTLGALAARITGVPAVVYSSHGHPFHQELTLQDVSMRGWKRSVFWWVRRMTVGLSDRVVALSEHDLQEQVELGLGAPENYTIIPNGLRMENYEHNRSSEQVEELRRQWGIGRLDPLLMNVGRLVEEKGQELLIRATHQLTDDYPDLGCVLVGEGPRRDALQREARRLGLDDRVVFLGSVDQIPEVLPLADVFVFPSRYESQGMALMEAMAAGVPCVSSTRGGLGELVKPGKTALALSELTPEAIVECVRQILCNRDLRNRLVDQARQRVRERYRLETVVDRTLLLYEDLLE